MSKPVWVWWDRNEPEDGLLGFHTKEDRDRFSNKEPGPYRRRISPEGKTISQIEEWKDMMAGVRDVLSRRIIP